MVHPIGQECFASAGMGMHGNANEKPVIRQ